MIYGIQEALQELNATIASLEQQKWRGHQVSLQQDIQNEIDKNQALLREKKEADEFEAKQLPLLRKCKEIGKALQIHLEKWQLSSFSFSGLFNDKREQERALREKVNAIITQFLNAEINNFDSYRRAAHLLRQYACDLFQISDFDNKALKIRFVCEMYIELCRHWPQQINVNNAQWPPQNMPLLPERPSSLVLAPYSEGTMKSIIGSKRDRAKETWGSEIRNWDLDITRYIQEELQKIVTAKCNEQRLRELGYEFMVEFDAALISKFGDVSGCRDNEIARNLWKLSIVCSSKEDFKATMGNLKVSLRMTFFSDDLTPLAMPNSAPVQLVQPSIDPVLAEFKGQVAIRPFPEQWAKLLKDPSLVRSSFLVDDKASGEAKQNRVVPAVNPQSGADPEASIAAMKEGMPYLRAAGISLADNSTAVVVKHDVLPAVNPQSGANAKDAIVAMNEGMPHLKAVGLVDNSTVEAKSGIVPASCPLAPVEGEVQIEGQPNPKDEEEFEVVYADEDDQDDELDHEEEQEPGAPLKMGQPLAEQPEAKLEQQPVVSSEGQANELDDLRQASEALRAREGNVVVSPPAKKQEQKREKKPNKPHSQEPQLELAP